MFKIQNGFNGAEIIAAFYMNSFVLLRPILINYSHKSFIILLVEALLLISWSVVLCKFRYNKKRVFNFFCIFIGISIIVGVDYIFRKNINIWNNSYYYFLIYGVVTALLLFGVYNYERLLFFWSVFAFLGGIIIMLDPFNNYTLTGDYMGFGKNLILSFAASVIFFFYYKKRLFIIMLLFFLFEILFFANRGSILVATAILLFCIFLTEKDSKRIKRFIFLLLICICAWCFIHEILDLFSFILDSLNLDSYSLNKFKMMLNNGLNNEVTSGRNQIWFSAVKEIKNNWLIGMGTGGFQSKYGYYVHNFIIDIIVSYGIFLGTVIIIFFIGLLKNTIKYRENKCFFIFSCTMFIISFGQLMFSFTFWQLFPFWIFLIINISCLPALEKDKV